MMKITDLQKKFNLSDFDIELIKEMKRVIPKHSTRMIASVKHVSSSGMSRHITFVYYSVKSDSFNHIDYLIRKICGYRWNRNRTALQISGSGMDMIYSVLYDFYTTIGIKAKSRYTYI